MKNLLNNEKALKVLGVTVMIAGFGISMIQKQLDDKKLEELVQKEVQKQLEDLAQ